MHREFVDSLKKDFKEKWFHLACEKRGTHKKSFEGYTKKQSMKERTLELCRSKNLTETLEGSTLILYNRAFREI